MEPREKIKRFEDIIAWQLARSLARDVYEITRSPELSRDFGFCSQFQRAATSIMNNIAEGFERRGQGEFAHFLLIAKASSAEVRSMAYLGSDIGVIPEARFRALLAQTDELARVLSAFRARVVKNQHALRHSDAGPAHKESRE